MLVPAITRKEEICASFHKYMYTKDMIYETGGLGNWIPNIQDNNDGDLYQYAIVDNDNKLLGFFSYYVDWYSSNASRFGLISFDRGNPIIGLDVFRELEKLISQYHLHRVEWRMIGGNPVERAYDRFCKKYNGTKHILKDVMKDREGNYHDDIIYEIITTKE